MFGDRWNVGFRLGSHTRGYGDRSCSGFGVSGPFIGVMGKQQKLTVCSLDFRADDVESRVWM